MPKRKSKAGTDGGSSRLKKQPKKRNPSKKSASAGSSAASAEHVVSTFARGLSHQIPTASLAHIAKSSDSIRLLLEKSTESLPMGSAIRKAVGENFALCVETLTKEVQLRLDEQRALVEPGDAAEAGSEEEHEGEDDKFAVFSSAQYQGELQKMQSMSEKAEAEKYRRLLACTDYASAEVILPLDETKPPSAKSVLNAFRSACTSGRVDESTFGGYVTRMLLALQNEVEHNPGPSAKFIREFMACFAIASCAKEAALMSNSGKTAFEFGEIFGLLMHIAITRSMDYSDSGRSQGASLDGSDESSDEYPLGCDFEDFELGKKQNIAQLTIAKASAIQDVTCNLALFLMGARSVAPHIVGGIVRCMEQVAKTNAKELMQTTSDVLVDALIESSSAPKSAMPSKKLKSGQEKISMIQRWAVVETEKATRDEATAIAEQKRADQALDEQVRGVDNDSSDESSEDEAEEELEDTNIDNNDAEEGAAPDEALFVIDTAPDEDGQNGSEAEIKEMEGGGEEQDDEEEEYGEKAKNARPAKDEEKKGSTTERPPRPGSIDSPRRSARVRSRGDSMSQT